ncbi:MAG: hypothetical protein AAF943_13025 [Pseudomonadota bacterium]
MKHIFSIAASCLFALSVEAATLGEEDRIEINRLNATDFEVIEGRNFGAAEFWCGAATFVERRNQLSELTQIYVKRPEGPSLTARGQDGVVFTTDAAGLPRVGQTYSVTVDQPGASLKSVQARRFCRDAFTRSTK